MVKRVRQTKARWRRIVIGLGIVLVLAALCLAALELTGVTHIFRERKATSGAIPTTAKPKSTSASKEKEEVVPSSDATTSPESPKQGDSTTTPPPTGAAPITPFGNFVSNHSPSIDGSPTPSNVQSVCNTTPGAICRMEFTNKDKVIKTLTAQKTDGNGAAYWYWDVKQAGFTVGTWKVTVIAELNGQTTTANDVQNLEVGP